MLNKIIIIKLAVTVKLKLLNFVGIISNGVKAYLHYLLFYLPKLNRKTTVRYHIQTCCLVKCNFNTAYTCQLLIFIYFILLKPI